MEHTVKGQPVLICLKYFFSYSFLLCFAFVFLFALAHGRGKVKYFVNIYELCVAAICARHVRNSKPNYDFISCFVNNIIIFWVLERCFERIVRVMRIKIVRLNSRK